MYFLSLGVKGLNSSTNERGRLMPGDGHQMEYQPSAVVSMATL